MGTGAYLNKMKAPSYPNDFSKVEYKMSVVNQSSKNQPLLRPQLLVNSQVLSAEKKIDKVNDKLVIKMTSIKF